MSAFTIEYETVILPKIQEAITDALQNEVSRAALNAIEESANMRIYQAYSPRFWSRRGSFAVDAGYESEVGGDKLTITAISPLQNLYGDSHSEDLGDIVAEGWGNFNMPFARPWMDEAITENMSAIESALRTGMERQGF